MSPSKSPIERFEISSTASQTKGKQHITAQQARDFLSRVAAVIASKPFKPHRIFKNAHAQTIASYAWPRRFRLQTTDQERVFEVAPEVKVLAHCRWQADRAVAPTIVLWHGIEGSSSAVYMLAMAGKAFREGFNVIRMNLRNCGNTEHLTPTIYHGGLTADLQAVVRELIESDRLRRLFLVGFSLGGNMVLKLAGEYGDDPPTEIHGVCAVSPSVDLGASADAINRRSNWIYQQNFLRRLRQKIIIKQRLYPDRYDVRGVHSIRTIREFDDRFTAAAHGFRDANDYYRQASSIHLLDRIRVPTLIIHAQDDPFIPFAPLRQPAITENPYLLLVAPRRGGHVAFVGVKSDQEDRFWAENRVVEFCRLGEADHQPR